MMTTDLKDSSAEIVLCHTEIEDLRATNAALLEALEELLAGPSDDWRDAIVTDDGYTLTPLNIAQLKASEAIRKAKEG
jgi:hypothetical protein